MRWPRRKFLLIFFLLGMPLSILAQSELEEKKLYYDSVYNEAIASKNDLLLAESCYLYGKYHHAKGEYARAAQFFHKALQIHENHPPSDKIIRVLHWLALNAIFAKDGASVLDYSKKLYAVSTSINNQKGKDIAVGVLRQSIDNAVISPDTTDSLFQLALSHYNDGKSPITPDLGSKYFAEAKYQEAFQLFSQLLSEREAEYQETGQVSGEFVSFIISTAHCLIRLKRYQKAESLLSRAGTLIKSHYSLDFNINRNFYWAIDELYQKTNRWPEAYKIASQLSQLEKNQLSENAKGAVSELNIAYETKKKEQLLKAQQEEIKSRNLILILLSGGIILAITGGGIFYRLYKTNRRLRERNFYLLKEQNHRVKNNLQQTINLLNLQGRRLEDKEAKKAIEESKLRISSMSILQKQLYEDKEDTNVSLNEYLLEVIDSVLSSYGYRDINQQIEIEEIKVGPDDATALGLMCTELMTNSCKYAFPLTQRPTLYLKLKSYSDKKFQLSFSDNGPGITGNKQKERSFGLMLIDIEAKYFNARHNFSNENGLSFTLEGQFNHQTA